MPARSPVSIDSPTVQQQLTYAGRRLCASTLYEARDLRIFLACTFEAACGRLPESYGEIGKVWWACERLRRNGVRAAPINAFSEFHRAFALACRQSEHCGVH